MVRQAHRRDCPDASVGIPTLCNERRDFVHFVPRNDEGEMIKLTYAQRASDVTGGFGFIGDNFRGDNDRWSFDAKSIAAGD